MKTELKERIEKIYKKYGYDTRGLHLRSDRNSFDKNGLEIYAIKGDSYKVCFKNSNIHSQGDMDYINKQYGIRVHHGSNYSEILWDTSNCYDPDCNKKDEYPTQAYYSCEPLNEEKAIELFNYLCKRNI